MFFALSVTYWCIRYECRCFVGSLTCILWLLSREREEPPRFARPGTFEFEYAKRWKSLDEMEKQQRQQVEKNMQEAREKLEAEMEDAYHEHQANLLRQGGILWCLSVKVFVVL